jgi:hypothetical protein
MTETNRSNDSSRGIDTTALRSLRRHPRSGFRRNRPTVSSHFTTALSEATPSCACGATPSPTANVPETTDDSRRSESPADPTKQVMVSRRPGELIGVRFEL